MPTAATTKTTCVICGRAFVRPKQRGRPAKRCEACRAANLTAPPSGEPSNSTIMHGAALLSGIDGEAVLLRSGLDTKGWTVKSLDEKGYAYFDQHGNEYRKIDGRSPADIIVDFHDRHPGLLPLRLRLYAATAAAQKAVKLAKQAKARAQAKKAPPAHPQPAVSKKAPVVPSTGRPVKKRASKKTT